MPGPSTFRSLHRYDPQRMHAAAGADRHDRPMRKTDPQSLGAIASEKTTVES